MASFVVQVRVDNLTQAQIEAKKPELETLFCDALICDPLILVVVSDGLEHEASYLRLRLKEGG